MRSRSTTVRRSRHSGVRWELRYLSGNWRPT